MANITPDQLLPPGRLRWACRRGMLELDILLDTFLEKAYDALNTEEKWHFQRLLDYSDQEILEFCMEQQHPKEREIQDVVEKIRVAVKC